VTTTFVPAALGQLSPAIISNRDRLLLALHPAVRAKVEALGLRAEACWAATRAATEGNVEAQQRLRAAVQDHEDAIQSERRAVPRPTEPGARVRAAAVAVDQARERAALRSAELDRVQRAAAAAGAVRDAVEKTITSTAPDQLAPVMRTPVSLEDIPADLERLRNAIADVEREQQAIAAAPVPFEEASGRLDAWLDQMASQYDPPVLSFVGAQYVPPGFDAFAPYRMVPLFASLPAWRAVLHDRLKQAYTAQPASVPSGERLVRSVELAKRRRELETEEELIVLQAERLQLHLDRRAQADPIVVATTLLGEAHP